MTAWREVRLARLEGGRDAACCTTGARPDALLGGGGSVAGPGAYPRPSPGSMMACTSIMGRTSHSSTRSTRTSSRATGARWQPRSGLGTSTPTSGGSLRIRPTDWDPDGSTSACGRETPLARGGFCALNSFQVCEENAGCSNRKGLGRMHASTRGASPQGSSAGPLAGPTTTAWSSRVHRTLVDRDRQGRLLDVLGRRSVQWLGGSIRNAHRARGKWGLQPTVAAP